MYSTLIVLLVALLIVVAAIVFVLKRRRAATQPQESTERNPYSVRRWWLLLGLPMMAVGWYLFYGSSRWGFAPAPTMGGALSVFFGGVAVIHGLIGFMMYRLTQNRKGPHEEGDWWPADRHGEDAEFKAGTYAAWIVSLILHTWIFLFTLRVAYQSGLTGSLYWTVVGLGMTLITGLFLIHDFLETPADPKHVSQFTFFGFRVRGCQKKEGFGYWPGRNWLTKPILQDARGVDFDLGGEGEDGEKIGKPVPVQTPDNVRSEMDVAVTYSPYDPVNYRDNGGSPLGREAKMDGIKDMIRDMIQDRIWKWAGSAREGPQTWKELRRCKTRALNTIVRYLVGYGELPKIDSAIPTELLLEYFDFPEGGVPPPVPEEWQNRPDVGLNWSALEAVLAAEPAGREEIGRQVRARRALLDALSRGEAEIKIVSLGIILERLSIKDIRQPDDLMEAARRPAIEREEREAETIELQHLRDRMNELQRPVSEGGAGMDPEQSRRTVLVDLKKATEEIKTNTFELGATAAKAVKTAAEVLAGLGGKR